jgi:outer membrane protein OmpA-like peptidoglycan-associated protein
MEGRNAAGQMGFASPITVEEIRTVERYPLLTYAFFSEGDATRPLRQNLLTKEQASAFTLEQATGDELGLYQNMLNIVARRLKEIPKAKITIVGTNADIGVERNAAALSKDRAETIKRYFTDVWGIDGRRITTRSRNLPQDPSVTDQTQGQEENRRAEITSDDEGIIAPIRRDETVYNASLASVNFVPTVDAPNGIDRWSMNVKQENKVLYSAENKGATLPPAFKWEFNGDTFRKNNQTVRATFLVRDGRSQEKSVSKTIDINFLSTERKREERIGDHQVNRSKLILFDYNRATLSARNSAIIKEVSTSILSTSTVKILGYTDQLGDPEYNLNLSQQRADAVRAAFGKTLNNVNVESRGLGSTQLLFPNDTPEGRFYCRMVTVWIESPVQQ